MGINISPTTVDKGIKNLQSLGNSDTVKAAADKLGTQKVNDIAARAGAQADAITAKEKSDPASVTRGDYSIPHTARQASN